MAVLQLQSRHFKQQIVNPVKAEMTSVAQLVLAGIFEAGIRQRQGAFTQEVSRGESRGMEERGVRSTHL